MGQPGRPVLNKREFSTIFDRVLCGFTSFPHSPAEQKSIKLSYYLSVKYLSIEIVSAGVEFVCSQWQSEYPPTPAQFYEICIQNQPKRELPPWEHPEKFPAFKHECAPKGTKIKHSGSYKLLLALSPYEAAHILCKGPFTIRCPNCGNAVDSYANPVIEQLMRSDPEGTKHWNPEHKGHMLCDPCAKELDRQWKMTPGGWRKVA